MKTLAPVAAAMCLAACSAVLLADPPVISSWTKEYDFSTDPALDGWVIEKAPEVPTAGWDPIAENLFLPGHNANGDESMAKLDVALITGKPSITSVKRFVLQADVFIPNDSNNVGGGVLWGSSYQQPIPSILIQNAGIQAQRAGDNKAIYMEGKRTSGNPEAYVFVRDRTEACAAYGNEDMNLKYPSSINSIKMLEELWDPIDGCGFPLSGDFATWYNDWIQLRIDYRYSDPNLMQAWIYVPWDFPNPDCSAPTSTLPAGWYLIGRQWYDRSKITGLCWQEATQHLYSSTNVFAEYVWKAGDVAIITNKKGVIWGEYPILAKISDSTIKLDGDITIGGDLCAPGSDYDITAVVPHRNPDGSDIVCPGQDWVRFALGGKYSWTNARWDNVKIAIPSPCNAPAQDIDGDADVDLVDFSVFSACFNGPNRPWVGPPVPQEPCACLDVDTDADVDMTDFGKFQVCFNGPNRPVSPLCGS